MSRARLLDLTLTTRDKGKEDAVPMCGVPHHAARGYIAKLTDLGHKVVICEQVEDPKLAKGIRHLLTALKRTLASLLARLKAAGQLVSDTQALGQLVEQITLTLLFSLDYQRILDREGEVRVVVYQIMMLVAPHLLPTARQATERETRLASSEARVALGLAGPVTQAESGSATRQTSASARTGAEAVMSISRSSRAR